MKTFIPFFNKFSVLISILFLFPSCSKNDNANTYDLTGNWKVVSFVIDNSAKITKSEANTWPESNNGDITVNFEAPDESGKGKFSGINVTNSFSGNYSLANVGEITIGPIATTFISEPEWANLFHAIGKVENYEIQNSKLIFYYSDKKSSITLVRN